MITRYLTWLRPRLKPCDLLTMGFFLLLNGLIVVFQDHLPHWQFHLLKHFAICLVVILVVPLLDTPRRGVAHFFRHCYPAAAVALVYWNMSGYIHLVFPGELDPFIIAGETALFGQSPNLLLQALVAPLLTEIMQWFYAIYWIFIPVAGALLYFGRKDLVCDHFMFYLLLTFYTACLGFILLPVAGPRFYMADQIHADYSGLLLADYFRGVVEQGGHRGCAFPSAHAAVSVLVTYFIREAYPRLAQTVFLPCVTGLCLAAVYGQYHYVTDVAAGLALGVVIGRAGVRRARASRPAGLDNPGLAP